MKTVLNEGYYRFEWMHRKANGDDFPVEVSLTPVAKEGKIVIHSLCPECVKNLYPEMADEILDAVAKEEKARKNSK